MTAVPPQPLRLRYAAVSDLGRYRKDNQDSGYASEHLLVVADGVGGAAYGDVASATAVELLRRLDRPDVGELLSALAGALLRVHDRLAEMVEADSELDGTSTTVTAALFDGRQLGFAHVGDSRAYLLRDGELRQLTKDHTFVQTLVDEGRITEEDSRVHPQRNIILKAVDAVHETEPDVFHVDASPGDRVLLCSDGCSGALTDHQIRAILAAGTVDLAALELVGAALDAGSTDNVTVVVAEVVGADTEDAPETSAALSTGPMLVGAAASQPRRGGLFGVSPSVTDDVDTGELDAVDDEVATDSEEGSVDPEELRYAPRPPRRGGRLRRFLFVALPLLLLAGVLVVGYQWSQRQYFVATDGPYVAIYRGIQFDLPVVELARSHEVGNVRVDQLPPFEQKLVEDGIVADDYADAKRIVDDLREQSDDGAGTPSPAPSSSPSPGSSPSALGAEAGTGARPTSSPGTSPSPGAGR